MAMWADSYKPRHMEYQLNISHDTCVTWTSLCRQIAFHYMIEKAEKLGGEGVEVEMDESKLNNGKQNTSTVQLKDIWVLSGYERGSGKVFMVPMKNRTRENFMEIIQEFIKSGTKIISDCWAAYRTHPNERLHLEMVHFNKFI